ncbi:MAG: HAMP domain-containing sensor histidine kinase [Nitrospiraceae bacterium]|nr:HAMP domain-containing sensor histidine kinase [Nitrospiraceae bacterium]
MSFLHKGLALKFLFLLLSVTLIGLSATFVLRGLMLEDFRRYLEGEMLDRISQLSASLESSYIIHAGWDKTSLLAEARQAYMQGLRIRVYGEDGKKILMSTEEALDKKTLPPLARKRIEAAAPHGAGEENGRFTPYDLFLGGVQIGRVEVMHAEKKPRRELVYVRRSNEFLGISVLALGGIAALLGVFSARRITRPVTELTLASEAISEGDLEKRVSVSGADELARLAGAFNRMAGKLQLNESLRKRLTSNMAHELRTPLGAMRGELEGMMDGYIPLGRDALESLYAETGRLRKILEGMEELAQAEASALALEARRFELAPFLSNIAARFSASFREKGVGLESPPLKKNSPGLSVFADPDRLTQVMHNLLSNSLKATGAGGKVTLGAYEDGQWTVIEVRDTGAGIRAEDLPFIFERFYRVRKGGLGIGLAIVKELVEAHGGRVEARSEYGRGSVFRVFLPAPQ